MKNLYTPASGDENEREISEAVLKKVVANHGTKVIVVNSSNKEKLQLIKNSFNELKTWHYDASKDFVYYKFLQDKTWIIILNNIKGTTEEKLKGLIIKEE
jgi:saccharopine dehydrogenase-like NADP-dependent oxidoreductase